MQLWRRQELDDLERALALGRLSDDEAVSMPAVRLRMLFDAARAGIAENEDRSRLDWLAANWINEDAPQSAGVRIERFRGSPEAHFADASYRLCIWGDTPLDAEGKPDWSRRYFDRSEYPTLRAALDAGRSGRGKRTRP